jgi:hypothetical protein
MSLTPNGRLEMVKLVVGPLSRAIMNEPPPALPPICMPKRLAPAAVVDHVALFGLSVTDDRVPPRFGSTGTTPVIEETAFVTRASVFCPEKPRISFT